MPCGTAVSVIWQSEYSDRSVICGQCHVPGLTNCLDLPGHRPPKLASAVTGDGGLESQEEMWL